MSVSVISRAFPQDIHDRLRTESQSSVTPRFNERFLLSLTACKACLLLDDELNILPVTSHMREIAPVEKKVTRIRAGQSCAPLTAERRCWSPPPRSSSSSS